MNDPIVIGDPSALGLAAEAGATLLAGDERRAES